eukprot:6192077-Pleurochrysis_carterae.AAC.1
MKSFYISRVLGKFPVDFQGPELVPEWAATSQSRRTFAYWYASVRPHKPLLMVDTYVASLLSQISLTIQSKAQFVRAERARTCHFGVTQAAPLMLSTRLWNEKHTLLHQTARDWRTARGAGTQRSEQGMPDLAGALRLMAPLLRRIPLVESVSEPRRPIERHLHQEVVVGRFVNQPTYLMKFGRAASRLC